MCYLYFLKIRFSRDSDLQQQDLFLGVDLKSLDSKLNFILDFDFRSI